MLKKGVTCTIIESSTKQYRNNFVVLPEIPHLKADPRPDSLIHLSRGVLTMDQMSGDTPFPCHSALGGGGGGGG